MEKALADLLDGTTPEWQNTLADLLHDLNDYESFGNHGLLGIVDADTGVVIKTEPRNPCQA